MLDPNLCWPEDSLHTWAISSPVHTRLGRQEVEEGGELGAHTQHKHQRWLNSASSVACWTEDFYCYVMSIYTTLVVPSGYKGVWRVHQLLPTPSTKVHQLHVPTITWHGLLPCCYRSSDWEAGLTKGHHPAMRARERRGAADYILQFFP